MLPLHSDASTCAVSQSGLEHTPHIAGHAARTMLLLHLDNCKMPLPPHDASSFWSGVHGGAGAGASVGADVSASAGARAGASVALEDSAVVALEVMLVVAVVVGELVTEDVAGVP